MKPAIIALLSDFGTSDPYTGIMKGVIAGISPNARLIDLTHEIPPADIQRGAFVLWQAARDFPQDAIFLAVVDPGVGTSRKAICLKRGNQYFIGPDNGLFSYLLYQSKFNAWELTNPDYRLSITSSTFHGRDVFAPAAAYLAKGIPAADLGVALNSLQQLPLPRFKMAENSIEGEVISVDQFGNLFTSLGQFTVSGKTLHIQSWINPQSIKINDRYGITISVNNFSLPLVDTFASIRRGESAGLIGSTGLLEIICNQGSAAAALGLKTGDPLFIKWQQP